MAVVPGTDFGAPGQVRLSFEDGLADKMLGPGQYFGEMALAATLRTMLC